MLQVSADGLNSIEQNIGVRYEVSVYFQEPETYTNEDYLQSVGNLNTSMSSEGGYDIANTTVTLKNIEYYFSRKFANELPVNKLVEIYALIASEEILVFRGIVGGWKLTGTIVTLNINA